MLSFFGDDSLCLVDIACVPEFLCRVQNVGERVLDQFEGFEVDVDAIDDAGPGALFVILPDLQGLAEGVLADEEVEHFSLEHFGVQGRAGFRTRLPIRRHAQQVYGGLQVCQTDEQVGSFAVSLVFLRHLDEAGTGSGFSLQVDVIDPASVGAFGEVQLVGLHGKLFPVDVVVPLVRYPSHRFRLPPPGQSSSCRTEKLP